MIYQNGFKGKCLSDYYLVEKRYPEWNYQENH